MGIGTLRSDRKAAAMRVHVELLALLRARAGTGTVELELGEDPMGGKGAASLRPTVLAALQALAAGRGAQGLDLLEGREVRKGLLVFLKSPEGAMRRVISPEGETVACGETLVLATAMDGG